MGLMSFTDRGIADDDRKFFSYGINGLSHEALPYYARWVRQDLIGMFYLLNRLATLGIVLLVLIAVPLWMIALK